MVDDLTLRMKEIDGGTGAEDGILSANYSYSSYSHMGISFSL